MNRIRHQVRVHANAPLGFQSLQLPSLALQHVRAARIHAARHRHHWEGTVRRFLPLFSSRVLVRQSPSQGNELKSDEYPTDKYILRLLCLFQAVTNRAGMSLGASGAVMGILGIFGTAMPDARLQIIFLPMITFTASIGIKSMGRQGLCFLCLFSLSICIF